MNAGVDCHLAHLDGAYVLGALAPEERLEFERHLPGCPVCSRSVQQFAGLPGLLSQVSAEVVESDPVDEPVPDTLLPALVREVRRTQHRRRWAAALGAAAAVLVVGVGSVAVVNAVDGEGSTSALPTLPPTTTPPARQMDQVGQRAVDANLAVTTVAWGTKLDLTCSYAGPHREYDGSWASYSLVVHSREGKMEQVASWKALPGKTMRLTGATALAADDIAWVEVRTADGQPILQLEG
jgi:hypothetical protein